MVFRYFTTIAAHPRPSRNPRVGANIAPKRIHTSITTLNRTLTAKFDSDIVLTQRMCEFMPMMAARCWRRFFKEWSPANGKIKYYSP